MALRFGTTAAKSLGAARTKSTLETLATAKFSAAVADEGERGRRRGIVEIRRILLKHEATIEDPRRSPHAPLPSPSPTLSAGTRARHSAECKSYTHKYLASPRASSLAVKA